MSKKTKLFKFVINLLNLIGWHLQKYHRPFLRFLKTYYEGNIDQESLIGAEIGVQAGINAYNMLSNLPIEKLYLIDPYKVYDDYQLDSQEQLDNWKKQAQKRLARWNHRLVRIEDMDAHTQISDKLDFAYIDGNHKYEYVLQDMENYYHLLKKGGILAGHDIHHPTIKKAFFEFCRNKYVEARIVEPDWIIIKIE